KSCATTRTAGSEPDLPGGGAGVVSDAETAIAELNRGARLELQPLARLLLRTESIASSKVEGMQVDARTLARPRGQPGGWKVHRSRSCRDPGQHRCHAAGDRAGGSS